MSRATSLRRLLLWLVAGLLLLVVVVFSYQAVRTVLALRQAKNDASALSAQLRHDNVPAVRRTLRALVHSSATARGNSDNVLWDAASHLPYFGDDIEAVQVMSKALADASHSASGPANVLLDQVEDHHLRSADGTLDLTAIGDLADPLHQLTTALQGPSHQVGDLEPSGLLSPLRDVTSNVQDQLGSLLSASRGGEAVAHLLPTMLGESAPRHYLLVVQNNAETRSTGGLPGSLSILNARNGVLSLGGQHSVDDYTTFTTPVVPLTTEEKDLYGSTIGEDIRDTNLTPDFPRAAQLMAALTQRSFGTKVDGVISVDPVVLSYVLKATGPVMVGHEKFTAGNVVPTLLNKVYQRFDSRKEQQAYFDVVARGIFDTLIHRDVSPVRVLHQLGRGVGQHRLLVWSAHPDEQSVLARTTAAGVLPRDVDGSPHVGLYLNDGTAAKIEYYLDYDSSVRSAGCTPDGRQTLQVGMNLTSSAPRRGYDLSPYTVGFGKYAAKGTMRLNLRLYAPTGGTITGLVANGQPIQVVSREHDGREVAVVTMFIRAREQVRLSAEIQTRAGQAGDPVLDQTPGVRTHTSRIVVPSSCP